MLEIDIYKYNLDDPNYIDDWTSISDIGQKFHGQLLTYQSYLQEEDRYVNTIQELLQFLHIQNLTVDWCSKFFSLRYHQKHGRLTSVQSQLYQKLDKGLIVNRNEVADIIRLNLRESIDCSLSNSIITIYFDYDYYMSIKIADKSALYHITNIIKKHGLFWRPSKNHYDPGDEDNKIAFGFTWNNGLVNPPGDYHHDLRISKDDPLNRTYTEWSHFDEIENGLDWGEYRATEQKYLQLVLDFLEYFQVNQLAVNGGLGFTTIQELGVPAQYFTSQEEVLFQKLQEYDETVEDWTVESFIIPKEDFSTLFQLIFKDRFNTWISTDSVTIQFDSSFRLYLSFYGHKKKSSNWLRNTDSIGRNDNHLIMRRLTSHNYERTLYASTFHSQIRQKQSQLH